MKPTITCLIQSSCLVFSSSLFSLSAMAQVTTDGTTSTTVTSPDGSNFTINDGDRAGANLFHSFQDFSVPTNGSASFNNAVDIQNIFSRVTGGNLSNIDGLIRANGSANLFLINPAGIIFGSNARLDIGGSFLGSTADSLLFEDGTEFIATDGQNKPILTINPPIGLGFRDNPSDLQVQGSSLEVKPNRTLALVGGDINLAEGNIVAPGGRVELGGLSAAGIVNFNENGSLSFPQRIERADITLTNQATVDVRAGGGGFINFNARNLTLSEKSKLFAGIAKNLGSPNAQAGDITINATESVRLIGTGLNQLRTVTGTALLGRLTTSDLTELTGIFSGTEDAGKSGNIMVNTPNLLLQNGSFLVNTVLDSSNNNTTSEASGNIIISDSQQVEINSSFLSTLANRNTERDAGDITINTERLLVQKEGAIASSTFGNGKGGDININASESIEVKTTLTDAITPTIISSNSIFGQGEAGDIKIDTRRLILREGGNISSASGGTISIGENQNIGNILEPSDVREGSNGNILLIKGGLGGDLKLEADFIEITGRGIENQFSSALTSESTTSAQAGNININTNKLIISNDAEVRVGSISTGAAGNLEINARSVEVNNQGKITADNANGIGGELELNADSLTLENQASISASTTADRGQGGILTLNINDSLQMRDRSLISARADSDADGGNVNIDAELIIASPNQNNDIIASAEQGTGGNINITAEGVFGLEERSSTPANNTNDIDASSEFGLDGTVLINTPDVGALQEVIEAPKIVELQTLGINACSSSRKLGSSNFELTGKGGVPPQLTAPLNSDRIFIEGESISTSKRQSERVQTEQIKPLVTAQGKIYPARGIVFLENGDIVLTAYRTNTVQRDPDSSLNCFKS